MLSSDLNKLADSYAQIVSEAIDPKGAARMDASKGKKKETQDEIDKRLMLGKYSPGSKKKKTDKCTSESFYLKRLQAMNPVFAEQYFAIAEVLVEDGYENSRLIDNIVEAFPPEVVGYEFRAALKAVNPRINENLDIAEKRQARAIIVEFNLMKKLGDAKRALFPDAANSNNPNVRSGVQTRQSASNLFGPPKNTPTKPATPPSSTLASQQPSSSRPPSPPKNQGTGERSAAANVAKQQAAKLANQNKSSTPSPSPKPTPTPTPTPKAKPTGPITSRAAIAGGSKEGQGPKSAASTYTGANDKTKVGRYKTLAQHRAAVAANKKSMSEGSVFESLKKARENVGASTCWDGYKAKGTKKKGGKDVPNCVKEEDLLEAPYGVSPNKDPMVPKSHNERMREVGDRVKKQGVFLPPYIGPEPKRVKAKPTTQTAGYEPEGEMVDEGSIGDRTRKVVGDQRQGVHGDDDAIRRDTNSIKNNLLKMRPYGAKGFPATVNSSKDKKTTQVAHFEPEGKLLEGIRDNDPEKGTKERKARLEKKRGMKVDDHPEYLETNMKKRQENNEKARKDMDKVKGQKNPHFEDVSHYDVILAFLSENNLIESVDEAEEIMMQLTGAQIVEIIDEFMNN